MNLQESIRNDIEMLNESINEQDIHDILFLLDKAREKMENISWDRQLSDQEVGMFHNLAEQVEEIIVRVRYYGNNE